LVSGLRRDSLSEDFAVYFRDLGKAIGGESRLVPLPRTLEGHFTKAVQVRPEIAAKVRATLSNVIVERLDPPAQFDAVIVTNVFVYFGRAELALALANIQGMLKPGGYLLHNELRPEVEELGRYVGLVPVQARTIQVSAGGARTPLLDAFVIQQRR